MEDIDRGIGQWIYKHAQINGDHRALADDHGETTYAQLNQRTNQLAAALCSEGVRPGDRIAILAVNSAAYLEIIFAAAKLGAIAVPINHRLSASEVTHVLTDSGATWVFVSPRFAAILERAVDVPGIRAPRIVRIDHGSGEAYESFLVSGHQDDLHSDVAPEDSALIVYTSGTTGRSKGARLTHRAITANSHHALLMGSGLSRYDVTVTPAPLFHVGGLAVHTLPLLYTGGFNRILESFQPRETLEAMGRTGATVQFLVPAMWEALTKVEGFHDLKPRTLRFARSGGAPAPLTLIKPRSTDLPGG